MGRKIAVIGVLLLALASEARASWVAPVTVNNRVGDTIYALIRIDRWGSDGFHFTTGASGGEAWNWLSEGAWDGGPNTMAFYVIANVPNVTLWSDTWGGSSSGWRAHFEVVQVVPAPTPQPRPDLVAVSPEQRDKTKAWSKRIDKALVSVDSLVGISSVYCVASLESDMCFWARTYVTIAVGLRVAKWWVNLLDPFDPAYRWPYEPAGGDLGLSCENGPLFDYCVWMANRAQLVSMYWDGAYNSANRAQSCSDMGEEDCFWMQWSRMRWFLWAAGVQTEAIAYGMAVAADGMPTAEASGHARATSDELYEVAADMKGLCSWC